MRLRSWLLIYCNRTVPIPVAIARIERRLVMIAPLRDVAAANPVRVRLEPPRIAPRSEADTMETALIAPEVLVRPVRLRAALLFRTFIHRSFLNLKVEHDPA